MSSCPRKCTRPESLGVMAGVLSVLTLLVGCGYSGSSIAVPAAALQGSVHGGDQPVRGSSIQLYVAGTSGNGSSAQGLLSEAVQTDDDGNFSIPAGYGCPAANSLVFVMAKGGTAGSGSGANNSALSLMAALGSCASLSRVGPVSINEVTTIGSVWPLAPFMKSSTAIGSAAGDLDFLAAVSSIPEFINIAAGSSPGTATAASSFTESSKLNSLADMLAGCIHSSGGSAGDSSPCGELFSIATPAGESAPTDTITAAMNIAQHPANKVAAIFNLTAANTPFQPALSSAPADWTLSLTYPVAVPTISLPTGDYTGPQQVVISDATPNSTIYYTTDGTVPTSASSIYTAPITVSVSTTIEAIAFLQGSQSGVATASLTIAASPPAGQKLVFLQQPTNAVAGATITPAVQVEVEDDNGNPLTTAANPVSLALTGGGAGLSGTLTVAAQNGIATFSNLSLNSAGNYTLMATSPGVASATSATFTITAPNTGTPITAAKLAFLQQPANAPAGAVMAPVTVAVEDSSGNMVSGDANLITLALNSGPGLGGTLTVVAQNGIASFSNLSLSSAGNYTLMATSPGVASATSAPFTISAPNTGTPITAAKLAFLQQPTNAAAGAVMAPVTVAVEDNSGDTVSGATNLITVSLNSGSGLGGTLTVAAQNGIATFSTLNVSAAGTYSLQASSAGLASAVSSSFTITAPAPLPTPAKLAFLQQPSNAVAGAAISPAVTVAIEDSNGNTVSSATNIVALTLTSSSGLQGTITANPQYGIATFSSVSVSAAGTYTLSAGSSGLTAATSASFTITLPSSSSGTTYYLSPTGSDSNSGLSSGLPWLTPNHALTCGDVISAQPGTYDAANFGTGKWGTVSCPAGNNVAWLQCATFDSCKVRATSSDGMWVDQSYWGVQGWEINTSNSVDGACFHAGPRSSTIHHIIFANDIANGCMGGGFTAYDRSTSASVDYIVYIGNIAYNSAQGSGECFSGFNIYQPIASDNNAGTHMFVAGNFSWGNIDANPCAGTAPTDGEGINFDTWDFSQGGGSPYTQQGVIENNIEFSNGGDGIEVENNSAGGGAAIYIKNNTQYGDRRDDNQTFCTGNGEIDLYKASHVSATKNLVYTGFASGCQDDAIYAIAVSTSDATNVIDNNFASGVNGNNTFLYSSGSFTWGLANILGTNPGFSDAANPSAPACSGSASVTACMAATIAGFLPTVSAAKAYGYQQPSLTNVFDPLFPQWLCHASLPSGLVTMGCE